MGVFYIASNQSGAGQTAVSVGLASGLSDRGSKVALFKPLSLDAKTDNQASRDDNLFYQNIFASHPKIGKNWPVNIDNENFEKTGAPVCKKIIAEVNLLLESHDDIIIDGISGFNSDSISPKWSRLLAKESGSKVIAVVNTNPETIIDEALKAKGIFEGDLAGIIINGVTKFKQNILRQEILPALKQQGLNTLATLPEDRRMLSLTVEEVAEHLEGKILGSNNSNGNLIEYFMVGGWTMDPGKHVFSKRDQKAVIMRYDRPDLQMAALATNPICIILTGGEEPIEYIRNEIKNRAIPAILVRSNTLETMDKLDTIAKQASIYNLQKIKSFRDMFQDNFDFEHFKTSIQN